jgi:DNA mismatch repair protein MutS
MVEMSETATILKEATAHSLVVLDEVGRGTSTFDGVSIAWSVAEYLHDQARPLTMFATHYHELTDLASHRDAVVNASVSVKQRDGGIVFLRKLKDGAASKSYGVHVAALAGLPQAVLERAFSLLERLESDTKERQGLSRRKVSRNQLSLFGQTPAETLTPNKAEERGPSEAEEALRTLKIESLTPLQALVELDRLRRLVEERTE